MPQDKVCDEVVVAEFVDNCRQQSNEVKKS